MAQRNDGYGEINTIQNCFTAYLLKAVKRAKRAYITQKNKKDATECPVDIESAQFQSQFAQNLVEDIPFKMRLEYLVLQEALEQLTEWERYVLFQIVLYGLNYEELTGKLGLQYGGVAAIYYRVLKKLRRELQKDE